MSEAPPTTADPKAVAGAKDVLVQLDKAIRVFRMYDAGNDLVSKFLEELDKRVRGFMAQHGDVVIRVRPAAFEYQGTTIATTGLDEFALALFRRGITGMRIGVQVEREELRRFLALLSKGISGGGGDDDEDDLVTLLWREGLKAISYTSVLGYEEAGAEEEDEEAVVLTPKAVRETLRESMLENLAELAADTEGVLAQKASLRKENAADLSPQLQEVVAAVEDESARALELHLLEIVGEALLSPAAGEHLTEAEVGSLLDLLLRWLVEGGDAENLARFVGFLQFLLDEKSCPDFRFATQTKAFVAQGLSDEQLRDVVGRIADGPAAHLEALRTVVLALGRDRHQTLSTLVDAAPLDADKRALEELLVGISGDDPTWLVSRFRGAGPKDAVRCLSLVARVGIDHARKALAVRLKSADEQTQVVLISAFADIPQLYDGRVRESLLRQAAEGPRIRVAVVDLLCRVKDPEAATTFWRWTQDAGFGGWDPASKTAVFQGLLQLSAETRAIGYLDEVLGRKSLFGRKGLAEHQQCAIDALGAHGSPAAIALLRRHYSEGHKWLKEPCMKAMEQLAARARQAAAAARKESA